MKEEKMTARKLQAIETKKKIYQCAKALFRQCGVENVTVEDIMEKVGMSKGTFFVHYVSRDVLLVEYISEFVNQLDSNYESYMGTFSADTANSDIIMAMVERVVDNITEYVGYKQIKTAYRIQLEKTLDTSMLLNHDRKIYKMLSALVTQGMQTGEFRTDIPAEDLADHFVMAMRGATYEWCIRYPDFDLKNQLLRQFQILLRGIKQR